MVLRLHGRRLRNVALVIVPPLLGLALSAWAARDQLVAAQGARSVELLDAPSQWIPFRAELTITHPGLAQSKGLFYRSSNGSRRVETGPDLNDIKLIDIVDVQNHIDYVYESRTKLWTWRALPTGASAGPPRFRKSLPNWNVHPYRLALRAGESGSVNADKGFMAYRVVDAEGVMTLRIPELNFLNGVSMRPDGRYESFTNIVIGEPDSSLFLPPAGAIVTQRGDLRGHR